MPFTVSDSGVKASRELESGEEFAFAAESIRRERTGVHTRVSILQDGRIIAYDTFNVERDRERTHLSLAAHKRLGEIVGKAYSEEMLRRDLDDFCARIWDMWIGRFGAELLGGDPEIPPVAFALNPYILEDGGSIIFGPPGRGKSYLALLMAVSMDAGCDRLWPVTERRVLFINLERSRISLQRRIGMVNLALGLEQHRPLLFINRRGASLADIWDTARRDIEQHKVGAVILDSLSRAGLGKLTDDVPANNAMDLMNRLCETWVALGHTPRADEGHVYGSQMFDAAMDVGVQILAQRLDGGTMGLGLQVTKANDFATPPMGKLALEFDQYGLKNVREPRHHEFPELEAGRRLTAAQEIEEYLLGIGEASGSEIADEVGKNRSTVATILSQGAQFNKRRDGRQILYSVKAN